MYDMVSLRGLYVIAEAPLTLHFILCQEWYVVDELNTAENCLVIPILDVGACYLHFHEFTNYSIYYYS